MISQYKSKIPHIEALIKKLTLRKDADPLLKEMITSLEESINLDKIKKRVTQAKLDVIDDAMRTVEKLERKQQNRQTEEDLKEEHARIQRA